MDKKMLIWLVIGGSVVVGAISLIMNQSLKQSDFDCADICQAASATCPSLINEGVCKNNCGKLSEEAKKHLAESSSCQDIVSRPELIGDLLIPTVNNPESVGDVGVEDCQMACANYVVKCLTLVPNASKELLDEGLYSCIGECQKWNNEKIDCMIGALDCESMTNICGL